MAGTKFSGFTAGVSPVDATTFLVGYESVAGTNNRYDKAEIAGWLTSGAGAISTFYVADGTLSAARTVTMGTYNLAFASTTAGQEVSFGQNVKVSGQGYTEQHDSLAGNATVNWNDGNVQYILNKSKYIPDDFVPFVHQLWKTYRAAYRPCSLKF